ncbi:MAG: type II toxin-antitoxin system HicB family antitoxin [Clostridia bacterium]|nr:type II toxin-antitoxin system HicB family antitoxin [Clostridia bacterium]
MVLNSTFYYPAIFQKEDEGYSVWVPDIKGCVSQGETFDEAMEYIKDAIGLCLDLLVENGSVPPTASDPAQIATEDNQFLAIVSFDFDEYQKKHGSKSVKKTLTVPAWLNTLSERKNINFSQVLQNALIQELQIAE